MGHEQENGQTSAGKTFVNTTVVAAAPFSLQIAQAPNTSYIIVLEILKQCPESHDAMMAVRLSEVCACPFYGLRVEYNSSGHAEDVFQPNRNCQVAACGVLVKRLPLVAWLSGCLWLPG